jgi:hypothetical protein
MCNGSRIGEVLRRLGTSLGPTGVRRWGRMPKPEPRWLTVVVRVALDWRFLIAVAVLIRVLLKR